MKTNSFCLRLLWSFGLVAITVENLDAAPQLVSVRQFGTQYWDTAQALALDGSGNVFVGGYSGVIDLSDESMRDIYLRKYDNAGGFHWERAFGTDSRDEVWRLEADASGNIYVGGLTEGNLAAVNSGDWDAFVRKYDGNGQLLWTRQYGTSGREAAYGLAVASNGDLVVASGFDVRKYDQMGTLIWDTPLSASNSAYETANALALDTLGNVFVGGRYTQAMPLTDDAFITRFDLDGNRAWTKVLNSDGLDQGHDLAADGFGNAFFIGTTSGNLAGPNQGVGEDAFIAKFDDAGNHEWTRQFGGVFADWAHGVASDYEGGVFVSGWTNSGSDLGGPPLGSQDAFVTRFDASGNLTWSKRVGTASPDTASDIATNSSGLFILSGKTSGSLANANIGFTDAWIALGDRSAVPEPASWLLVVVGVIAVAAQRQRCPK